jgi:hypothetical protein
LSLQREGSYPSNDEDRKPAAEETTPPTPDGVSSTCAGSKRKSTSTCSGSVVSTRGQGIKREPVVKIETAPAPTNMSTDQVEASVPTQNVREGPRQNPYRAVTVRRKAAKRSEKWYNETPPQKIAVPVALSPLPQVEEIPARKKPRVEEPLPTTSRDEAGRKTASPHISKGLPTPASPSPTGSTRCQSPRQTQLK